MIGLAVLALIVAHTGATSPPIPKDLFDEEVRRILLNARTYEEVAQSFNIIQRPQEIVAAPASVPDERRPASIPGTKPIMTGGEGPVNPHIPRPQSQLPDERQVESYPEIEITSDDYFNGNLSRTINETFTRRRARPQGALKPGSILMPKASTVPVLPDVEHISEPEQHYDTCDLHKICVPVPVVKTHDLKWWPQCVALDQCLGSCCEGGLRSCQPTKIQRVRVLVRTFLPQFINGVITIFPDERYYEMDKHLACSCYRCAGKAECPPRQQFTPKCGCECKDRDGMRQCSNRPHHWWDEQQCVCKCNLDRCPASTFIDREQCRCRPVMFANPPNTPQAPTTSITPVSKPSDNLADRYRPLLQAKALAEPSATPTSRNPPVTWRRRPRLPAMQWKRRNQDTTPN